MALIVAVTVNGEFKDLREELASRAMKMMLANT